MLRIITDNKILEPISYKHIEEGIEVAICIDDDSKTYVLGEITSKNGELVTVKMNGMLHEVTYNKVFRKKQLSTILKENTEAEIVTNPTHLLKIEEYGSKFSIEFKVDYKVGIDLALQASKKLGTKWAKRGGVDGAINHMDVYFDLYEEGCITLNSVERQNKLLDGLIEKKNKSLIGLTRSEIIAKHIDVMPDRYVFCQCCDTVVYLNVANGSNKTFSGSCNHGNITTQLGNGKIVFRKV